MKLRAAIAGAGLMGFWHAKAIERCGGVVAAVLDPNTDAAQRLAAKFSTARVINSVNELFAGGDKIHVLHICSPLSSHFALAAEALTRGVHVLVEKPLTPTAAETAQLYALAADHRALLCPVHQFLFQRGVENAVRSLSRIGRLRHFEARFCSAGGVGKSDGELDAIVADILPHPLSLMHQLAPDSLRATGWIASRPAPGELRATLTEGEVGFSIHVSMNTRPTSTTLLLLGTEGTIHVDLFHGFSVIEPGAVSRWKKIVHPFDLSTRTLIAAGANLVRRACTAESAYPGLRSLVRSFYRAVRDGGEPPIPPGETIAVASIRDLLAATGKRS